jgi:TatD family hydrolase
LIRFIYTIYASVGVHPCELEGKDPSVAELLALAEDDNIIAIGETGLDYFHVEKDTADWQRERFRRHIAASNQSGKPMIIHTRNAKADTIAIMREEQAEKGVMHCFSEDWETAKAALDLGDLYPPTHKDAPPLRHKSADTASPKKIHRQSVLNQYKHKEIPPPTRS